jgi:phage tail sheath gpL-like
MSIPKAVASSVKTPGFYLAVNLLAAAANPGTAALRALLIAPKSSAGTIAVGTEVRRCFGPGDVATALGAGTLGHLAAKKFYQRHGLGSLDVVAPTASAGVVATGTQTFTGPATENTVIRLDVAGRLLDVSWLTGESATTFAARGAAAVNALGDDLPVTAAPSTGSIVYTAKIAGLWGNDILLNASIFSGGGGTAVSVNPPALSAGTLEPDFTTVLALVSTTEYGRIIACLSNADATDTSSSSNGERLALHIDAHESGNRALLQVGVVGHTGSVANAKAGAIDRNNEAVQYVFGRSFRDLPAELAGAEAGDALRAIALRPTLNRIGNVHNLYGPRDVVASRLSGAEIEDLLSNGVTPLDIDQTSGVPYLVAPITTHSTSGSAPDFRAFYLSDTDGLYDVARDLRVAIPQQFPNCSISPDLDASADALPAGVIELRDARAFIISRLRFKARDGVIDRTKLDATIESGELVVEIDESDESQVNVFIPAKIIKPLAKWSVVVAKVG